MSELNKRQDFKHVKKTRFEITLVKISAYFIRSCSCIMPAITSVFSFFPGLVFS